jgi:hypothetical protein
MKHLNKPQSACSDKVCVPTMLQRQGCVLVQGAVKGTQQLLRLYHSHPASGTSDVLRVPVV